MAREKKHIPGVISDLRKDIIEVPEVITKCSGININGRKLKSFIFTTDIAIICNTDADAVLAVYSFTPHPGIIQAISSVASMPVVAGVGGGKTQGRRSANISLFAESLGSIAVVVNGPTPAETIRMIDEMVDVPVIATIVSDYTNIQEKLDAGADILNVSGGANTVEIVKNIRKEYPTIPIIATGGRTDEQILATIEAGANAISYTPPSVADIFKKKMEEYRVVEKDQVEEEK
ncbi:beta/alpha barrel domain-containing protein [Jeotgalibaca ciconiae]|uniref:Hydrolase n=1 Tax=Jeotgalibaca ciconiae TaxID=2496265 RepID=A0A3S9H7L0_9LACT|nr:hydrolase [Jeotgalibaca ciconiae]AZP03327.1 hydrolase [Jeotgalibaca ciconiae]